MEQHLSLILINLMVKLGLAAAIAAALVRSVEFKSLLFREERSPRDRIYLVLWLVISAWIGKSLATGVWIRFDTATPTFTGDLTFETTLLLGAIAGRFAGASGGALLALPSLWNGAWPQFVMNIVVGLVGGQLRQLSPSHEEVWKFSPFNYLSVPRWIKRSEQRPSLSDWQMMFLVTILVLRFLVNQAARLSPTVPYFPHPRWVDALAYATSVTVIVIELKIWNGVRLQIKLEEQERLLLQARMAALQNQINPHFLFNTLNSVSSLVRIDPDTARELIIKLATILRRLLHSSDAFVPLQEEIDFIDNYLDIEVVRFGRDKLRVVKELDPASLDVMVPSMLLQPLVENSIKHGLSSKIDGGSIYLRSQLSDTHLTIEVEDDGVGMASVQLLERPTGLGQGGIGMANVAERLKVLYGDTARMVIDSRNGTGTLVRMKLPVLPGDAVFPVLQEDRSSTRR
ncbi:MAG TPA: histidine kinase [Terriglobales bacterium]|jgi:two-component system, LytTR family, sensor kinase